MLLFEACITLSGCLNPRPEELPSAGDRSVAPPEYAAVPVRESCNDNPALAGCQAPSPVSALDVQAAPASEPPADPAAESSPSFQVTLAPEEPDAGAPPSDAGTSPDSGAATDP